MSEEYKIGDRVEAVDCNWTGFGVVTHIYVGHESPFEVQWDDGIWGRHGSQWLKRAPVGK